jgi:tetratricopeptide (TPR) repeat protein
MPVGCACGFLQIAGNERMTGHRHYTVADLLAYLDENEDLVSVAEVAAAVASCAVCAARLNELQGLGRLIADRETWHEVDAPAGHPPSIMDVLTEADRMAREKRAAESDFAALVATPLETWPLYFAGHPSAATEGLVRRVTDAAVAELDRQPAHSLALLDAADSIASRVSDQNGQFECRSEVWKNRANALRILGRYEEALAATVMAERFTEEIATGGFMLAQIVYTRGTVLFKMGRFVETIQTARDASYRFAEYGDVKRVIHARNLEAMALTEQGQIAEGLRVYLLIARQLQPLDDPQMTARVTTNIAVSHRRLGNYDDATTYTLAAQQLYRALGAKSEIIRTEWTLGLIDLRVGETEGGLARLRGAAAAFEALLMPADAGFVKLDLTEELLRLEEWDEAGMMAGQAAEAFVRAGAKLHLSTALAFLREAVQQRSATLELVQYVRDYVKADEEERTFAPPSAAQ